MSNACTKALSGRHRCLHVLAEEPVICEIPKKIVRPLPSREGSCDKGGAKGYAKSER